MKHLVIQSHESFSGNITRLVLFYNKLAVQFLQRQSNVHENIHQARLCFKRIRSFLRLGRKGLGEQHYQHYNTFYRDLARSLSQLRDVTALIETLPQFIKTRRTKASKSFLTGFKNQLMVRRKQQLEQIITGSIMADVIKALQSKNEEISKWNFEDDARAIFTAGAVNIYARGRKLFSLSHINPDDHNLHEWRKQVKYFWYHLLVLAPIWPGIMTAWAKEVQSLSQMLGKHHDLSLLESAIGFWDADPKHTHIKRSLRQSISIRKRLLEKSCFTLGHKLYIENPDAVKQRLLAYWQ